MTTTTTTTPPTAQAAESVPAEEREKERIAFKDAHRHLELDEVPDAWGRPMFKHSHVETSWLGWIARAARATADSVLEDAAREAIEKVLALFPFNALIQKFTVNNGPCLTADNDDEFYSVKRVLAFLTEIKTTLDAARKQGANHD